MYAQPPDKPNLRLRESNNNQLVTYYKHVSYLQRIHTTEPKFTKIDVRVAQCSGMYCTPESIIIFCPAGPWENACHSINVLIEQEIAKNIPTQK